LSDLPFVVPAALFDRGVALGIVPLDVALRHADPFHEDGSRRYAVDARYDHAILAHAALAPAARERVEERAMEIARWLLAEFPFIVVDVAASPHRFHDPARQAELRALGVTAFAVVDRFVGHRPVHARLGTLGARRVLDADAAAAWAASIASQLARAEEWTFVADFVSNVGVLHLVPAGERSAVERTALSSAPSVSEQGVDENTESGLDGYPRYSDEEIAASRARARKTALRAIAPWVGPEHHALALEVAASVREKKLRVGSRRDEARPPPEELRRWLDARASRAPSLTLAELHATLASLPARRRRALVGRWIARYIVLAEEHRPWDVAMERNPRQHQDLRRVREMSDVVLPRVAPFLDERDARRMLGWYGL
jgi:hypothetical protein